MYKFDLSIVIGSLNRKHLLKQTINSIKRNHYGGKLQIIVVDGGSTDGTCTWLAKQTDIFTIVQPNYKIKQADGSLKRAHTWGEFINIGFRTASAPWVLMLSDDLILCDNAINNGLQELNQKITAGEKIGGGAIFFREYPCDRDYHVKLLPGQNIHVNHGFFNKEALEDVAYADENSFEFYGADGDLTMRLNLAGWKTIALSDSYAEHLNHKKFNLSRLICRKKAVQNNLDMKLFHDKYGGEDYEPKKIVKEWSDPNNYAKVFWMKNLTACVQGLIVRQINRQRGDNVN